ncbi:hypothetical protein KDH_67280 [Dictyobacter sp. S3.2.2.5]|uniref:non-specific serine/threonine protein kinase n=2 Tax=Dictyobacter halimunensis TaxID=3026934 RepID=A0ABQ6G069_9CHLR|nr:hypothetical protein KDH_67280 [Dictyobacter sp. S3.2.2.5]
MSDIYLARDTHTDQEVALKLVPTNNQEHCQRFQQEVRAAASLSHDHILPALDHGEFDSWCYLVMPYVSNGTLRDLTEAGPLSLEETGTYLHQISSALYYAHQHGIIHRDIKPSNILMRDRDFAYLADFGLVKNTRSVAESLTETGFLIGTAAYMAPELAEADATYLSDIYSLGIILFQMLTGDVPFKGSTPVGTFMQHLSKQPTRPSQINSQVPAELDAVVLRTLAKEPTRRYQSVQALDQAYQEALAAYARRCADSQRTTQRVGVLLHKRPRSVVAAAAALAAMATLSLGASAHVFYNAYTIPDASVANSIVQQTNGTSPILDQALYMGNNLGKPFLPRPTATPTPAPVMPTPPPITPANTAAPIMPAKTAVPVTTTPAPVANPATSHASAKSHGHEKAKKDGSDHHEKVKKDVPDYHEKVKKDVPDYHGGDNSKGPEKHNGGDHGKSHGGKE